MRWCMQVKTLKNTGKQCFAWENITHVTFMGGRGGSCSFHPVKKCSCKGCKCDEDGFHEELKCPGEQYHSAHVLKCEFHAMAYEIECAERAAGAEKVIDPGLGKGHSNLPESTFSVLTKFRANDINLHQKHYYASTNLGLIPSSETQGQLVGARESRNGRKKFRRRKVKYKTRSPWGHSLTGPVPNGRSRSGF